MKSLSRADAIEYDESDDTVDAWQVQDEAGAEWAIRKIAAAQLRINDIHKLAESERARLAHWEATATQADQTTIDALTEKLTAWHARVLEADAERKTIKLPHGTLSARKKAAGWEFDDAVYIPWALVNAPETIKRPEPCIDKTVAKKAVQALVEATGEVPPGATPIKATVGFTVKTN